MTHSSSKSAGCRPGSTREQERLSRSAGTSGRHGRPNLQPEKYVIYPRASSTASPTTSGSGRHPHLVGSARTWLQQPCSSARCRSHQQPRGGESRESSRIFWKAPRSDGPRAPPPEGRGTPRNLMPRLLDSCGKPRSTPGARGLSSGGTSSPRAAHRKMPPRRQLSVAPRRRARRSRKRNAPPPMRTLSPPPSTRTLGNPQRCQPLRQDAQGAVSLSPGARQAHP
jgi:hypothetical protein